METEKVCSHCKCAKPLDAFSPQKHGKFGRAGQCKDCANQAARERYQKNVKDPAKRPEIQAKQRAKYRARTPEQQKRYARRSHLGLYGYTTEIFAAHLKRIGNRCQICDRSFDGLVPHIDHDHAGTRKDVRGIICSACNCNLGYLGAIKDGDEMGALQLFLAYLDEFNQCMNDLS